MQEELPQKIVDVVANFITGPLTENPHRSGKKLDAPFKDQWSGRRGDYRVIYRIDEANSKVNVLDIAHRSHAYATRFLNR